MKGRRRQFRWVAGSGFAALAVSGGLALAGGSAAQASVSPGTGSSYAQALQVTPHEGSLAVGAVFGEALAGHTNTFARAQSQGLDLGAVGASLKGYNCNKPPTFGNLVPEPLQTETGAPGASQGQTQAPSQSDYGATEFVEANSAPYGEADTSFADQLKANGFALAGLASRSWSGVVHGVREAGATADVGSLTIAGLVTLQGMHWDVVYPSSGGGQPTGSFSIGRAEIHGVSLPTQNLAALGKAINQALSTLGLVLQIPSAYQAQGIEFVPPLQIEVVPNATRDGIVDPALNAVQPTYFQVANGLENGFAADKPPYNGLGQLETNSAGQQIAAALCQSDTPITVADITIASFTAAGYFNMALGGVNASSANLAANQFNLFTGAFGNLSVAGSSQFIGGTPGSQGTPGTPAVPGSSLAASNGGGPALSGGGTGSNGSGTNTSTSSGTQQASTAAATGYAAGGPLLAAGLGGLGLLALLAEADRRMMRRAQHKVTFEELPST